MSLSPYTIDVAPCQPDGTREIFLHHHQRPCFSTTHREVLHVCLAKWPSRPSAEEAAQATDLDGAETIRAHRTEDAYRALLESSTGEEADTSGFATAEEATVQVSHSSAEKADHASHTGEKEPALEDYLCVFHREELADQHGRYTVVQPQTICTTYRIRDTTLLHVVLHGVAPRDFTASSSTGSGGVFLNGRRQPGRGGGGGGVSAMEHQGLLYKPASDAWWMGSPLSVKPVYVAVGPVASPAVSVEEKHGDLRAAASVFPSNPPPPPPQGADIESAGAVTVVEGALSLADGGRPESPCSSPRQGSPMGATGEAATVEGRTAQGQFVFPRSRSSSPTPHSPPSLPPPPPPSASSLSSTAAATTTATQREGEVRGTPTSRVQNAATPANAKLRFVSLNATLLTQLPLYEANGGAVLPKALAVVCTGPDTIGLAATTPLYALDAVLWQWWPHRVRFSRLASNTSALSIVASPHPTTPRYVLFLYDAHYSRLRVLRTPDVHTGTGDLELLFSFSCGDLPFVLPCLHTAHPAPIAVCNHPRANCIAVYDVVALQERPSPDTTVTVMDVGVHQAAHPQCFGDVRLNGAAESCAVEGLDKMSVAAYERLGEGQCDPQAKWQRKACNAKTWAADAGLSVAHPIRSLLYHYASCLVLQYDWPGGAARGGDDETAGVLCDGGVGEVNMRTGDVHRRHGRRRRCEGTVSYTVQFPAVSADTQPLLVFMLEAVGAALGPRAVASVEYELLKEVWRCSCTPDAVVDPLEVCCALIRQLCVPFAPPRAQPVLHKADSAEGNVDAGRISTLQRDGSGANTCMFADPSMLTLQRVQQALRPVDDGAAKQRTAPAPLCKRDNSSSVLLWTPTQAALAVVALHLLYEACRLQEGLWKLLPPLAELNSQLSAQMQWPSYVEFYNAVAPVVLSCTSSLNTTAATTAPQSFRECMPPEVVETHFALLQPHSPTVEDRATPAPSRGGRGTLSTPSAARFADGEAPDLFRALSLLAMGSDGTVAQRALCDAWPLLRGVPNAHPIALANRLVLVYREVFGLPVSCPSTSDGDDGGIAGTDLRWWERVCAQLLQNKISARVVRQVLNTGVAYPLLEALTKGREQAAPGWPATLLDLVGRRDQCPPASLAAQLISAGRHVVEAAETNAVARQICVTLADDDGVSVRPDFRQTWRDARLDVAQNLFNTVTPISLSGYEDRPEELTGALELLSSRARAMPLGRGMLTMCTQSFKVQDSIPIPPLNLNGRTNDGIAIVNKATEDLMWPLFHNGCAAGLRFLPLPPAFSGAGNGGVTADGTFAAEGTNGQQAAPQSASGGAPSAASAAAQSITKQWVMYQTKNIGNAASRAGLLLATGILGHLTVLQRTDIFYLLISRQEQYVWREATTMAVMLGLSCSFCGTSSEAVFRCLSVHVQSLNPSAEDIEVSLDVQTAALVSMGLLCQQAPSNTFLVEVFLVEISRLPTDEHCSKREGYVLGAGFGLGQLLLGVGAAHGVAHVEDRLLAVMHGAPRRSVVSTRDGVGSVEETMGRGEAGHFLACALLSQEQREATFNSCASVYEGDCYNVFVSGPAAVVALGMIYLQTDSVFMAAKVAPPNRRTALQRLTPLMCHLRSTMASLIRWGDIAPTREWLYAQLPSCLLELTTTTTSTSTSSATGAPRLAVQQRNYLLMNLAHCIAGQVMAMGLRYAGTMDILARDVILAELQGFLAGRIGSTAAAIPAVQRVTGAYETCLLTCATALSLVMAGTGDLRVFGALQQLHRRTSVSYGSHMALSMSIGLLFLGSGRLSLSNNIASVAALFMAFYPLWPGEPEDNTHHLQALRQLYGLAVVPRVMEAVDAVSQQPVSVPVRIVLRRPTGLERSASLAEDNSGLAAGGGGGRRGGQDETREGRPREIRTRTPCLYPPTEMIDRVEVLSPRHYPLVFTPASRELQRSFSMEFRVMAKDGPLSNGGSLARRSPLELRLLDWLHRLFHQPTTTVAETLTMQDGVRLMLTVQRRLVATALAGDALLSGDFIEAVRVAMERRYGYIFAHRAVSPATAAPPPTPPHHPLYQIIVEGASCDVVVRGIAAHPRGTPAFPCDFTALVSSSAPPRGRDEHVDCEEAADCLDCGALRRWIVESLHYYGLRPSVQLRIREAFVSLGVGSADGRTAAPPSSAVRLTSLLRLQCATRLPLSTIENVWACCL